MSILWVSYVFESWINQQCPASSWNHKTDVLITFFIYHLVNVAMASPLWQISHGISKVAEANKLQPYQWGPWSWKGGSPFCTRRAHFPMDDVVDGWEVLKLIALNHVFPIFHRLSTSKVVLHFFHSLVKICFFSCLIWYDIYPLVN